MWSPVRTRRQLGAGLEEVPRPQRTGLSAWSDASLSIKTERTPIQVRAAKFFCLNETFLLTLGAPVCVRPDTQRRRGA